MCKCVYIYMCRYVHMYVYMLETRVWCRAYKYVSYMYIDVCMYVQIYVYICIYICKCVYIYMCRYVHMYVYMFETRVWCRAYKCVSYVDTYTSIYMYIYI